MPKRTPPSASRADLLLADLSMADLSRRNFLAGATLLGVGLLLPGRAMAEASAGTSTAVSQAAVSKALAATKQSPLIYISPLASDGSESSCHGEVWFVRDGDALLVVTGADRWRAACIEKGLDRARIWVGDFGVWKDSSFKKAPSYVTRASLDADREVHARVLEIFGKKYSEEWDKWGPRFDKGLASGERVMIRYEAAS